MESSNKISARFKVACVVKIKLFLMDWFYYNLIITNYVMQNTIKKFRQSSIVFEKPEIWKHWRALTILQFNIFCWNFGHVFYLPMSTEGCVGFFLFYVDLELFAKIKKDLVSLYLFFTFLLITQDLNKIKKIPHTLFCRKRAQNFSKKH